MYAKFDIVNSETSPIFNLFQILQSFGKVWLMIDQILMPSWIWQTGKWGTKNYELLNEQFHAIRKENKTYIFLGLANL